ncbi:MAG: carboxylating nicotinate-nucleotide diphosphorylase [Flavobacteriales bacterium]|nr:carboxylating nicotinate-nucleotide diphosphorylase [Flavobacteriales bacterium]
MDFEELRPWIQLVLEEDIREGDHSSLACVPEDAQDVAVLLVKEAGVLAGVEVAKWVFDHFDSKIEFDVFIEDGTSVKPGQRAFEVRGSARSILTVERTALNIMQRLSGIATMSNELSRMIAHTSCKLLDTRKTTPGMRTLEKMAVKLGGAHNHRHGLYDMIMIKDNHIDYAGGIHAAMDRTREYLKRNELDLRIEIEARDIGEVKKIMSGDVPDRVMLDNFSLEDMRWAVDFIEGRAETEASGGITASTIVPIAETGVDFISVGALTHSVKSLDLSLKAKSSLH